MVASRPSCKNPGRSCFIDSQHLDFSWTWFPRVLSTFALVHRDERSRYIDIQLFLVLTSPHYRTSRTLRQFLPQRFLHLQQSFDTETSCCPSETTVCLSRSIDTWRPFFRSDTYPEISSIPPTRSSRFVRDDCLLQYTSYGSPQFLRDDLTFVNIERCVATISFETPARTKFLRDPAISRCHDVRHASSFGV